MSCEPADQSDGSAIEIEEAEAGEASPHQYISDVEDKSPRKFPETEQS